MDDLEDEEEAPAERAEESDDENTANDELIELAVERFKLGLEATRDDFLECERVQDFIAGNQWPDAIKTAREAAGRPCLTLDHLNQYVRHVVNSGLMKKRDIRTLSMSGDADDKVAEILAGMVRQITQLSTAKVAYETGLRHTCTVGFGYWRVRAQNIPRTGGEPQPDGSVSPPQSEIVVRKIKDPRMVILDPFCDYPDARDAKWGFVLTKFTKKEFDRTYPESKESGVKSWHMVDDTSVMPWIGEGSIVVAEYFHFDDEGVMNWAILVPDKVLAKGIHHGDVMPIIRVVGEEYENDGKERRRGMVNNSSMDSQRAYNYSSSAAIESVALAPLAPFVAEAGQIEQFIAEWADAHKTPRAVLRYKGVSISGVVVPPPQRSQPAGIPAGWQGIMTSLIQDQQMIMGLAQPSVLGSGAGAVQSGSGVEAVQAPGEINTFHFLEHWEMSIEQTGRVIIAMIPSVYTSEQVVKITGDDGIIRTAKLNPGQDSPVMDGLMDALNKVTEPSYNVNIGRYDVAISTGPSSASKKLATGAAMTSMVTAYPELMRVAGDLIVGAMDIAGADVLAKRLKRMLPEGVTEEDEGLAVKLQQATEQNQSLQSQVSDMEKILMAEKEKAQGRLIEVETKAAADMQNAKLAQSAESLDEKIKSDHSLHMGHLKSQTELEIAVQNNIMKLIVAKIAANSKVDVAVIAAFNKAATEPTHEGRMGGYMGSMSALMQDPEGGAPQPEEQSILAIGG